MTYKKYIILLIISLLSSVLYTEGKDSASNKFAKEAVAVNIVASAIDVLNNKVKSAIEINNIYSNKWDIVINADEKEIVRGAFVLNYAATFNGVIIFQGRGINEITGQEIQFDLFSSNKHFGFEISLVKKKVYFDCPYKSFIAGDDRSSTNVSFKSLDPNYYSGFGWKIGTFKQLKECLLENIYVDRY